jgi:large subunit ribosomal protein L13
MANTKKSGPEDKVVTQKTAPKKAKPSESKTKRLPLVDKTYFAKKGEGGKNWKVVDASGKTLGRLASQVAVLLMGKHLPQYTPNNDMGDSVIVINAEKVRMTGKKWQQKVYQHHTNFPGGLKTITAQEMLTSFPERIIEKAVWRLMPKSRGHMARHWFAKLHVYAGPHHPHSAQKPVSFEPAHSTQGRS